MGLSLVGKIPRPLLRQTPVPVENKEASRRYSDDRIRADLLTDPKTSDPNERAATADTKFERGAARFICSFP